MKSKLFFIFISCIWSLKVQAQSKTDPWILKADNIEPKNYYGATVANGMIGLTSSASPLEMETVVLNGVYDKYGRGNVSNILKGFNFAKVNLSLNGKKVDLSVISDLQQKLDMKRAVLKSRFEIPGQAVVSYSVRALRQLPFTSLIEIKITAKRSLMLTAGSTIQAPTILQQIQNEFINVGDVSLLTSIARSPTGKHVLAASNAFLFDEKKAPPVSHTDSTDGYNESVFSQKVPKGTTYHFGIVSSETSTEHFSDPANEANRLTIYAQSQGIKKLVADHESAWDKLWDSRIRIEGNQFAQRDVNFALYNLYSYVREDSDYSLSPMGLSGLGYNGHIFWDAETWMFPPILILHPEIARSMLNYRYNRLQAAKQKAAAHGFDGAMFPWESADTGQEATPVWALTGPFEQHITADIAIACWNYFQLIQDKKWMKNKGYPILKAAANFWLSRVEKGTDEKYHINNVVGADEYAVHIDDDAFTNGAAKKALDFATKAARIVDMDPNPQWQSVAKNIAIHRFSSGVIKEHATYNGEKIKQADVNLLTYPLDIVNNPEKIRLNLKYYESKIAQGPAMSYAVYSLLWARLGDADKAYELFHKGYKPNEVPPFGVLAESAGGSNPYFATGAGGMLQTVLFGFGGLEITDQGVQQVESTLPRGWERVEITGVGIDNKTFIKQ